MPPPVELRPFHPADLPQLVALFRDTVRRVNSRDYTPEQIAAWAPDTIDPQRWASLADHFTLVAVAGPEIVGFSDLEPTGHIDRFYVRADWQRRGVGRLLLAEIVAEAQRRHIPRLHCEVSITARPFFETFGFLVVTEQHVGVRGVQLKNYRMERLLPAAAL